MEKGILYGIGVGVGDPEMLTLKAVNIFKELDVVVLPEAKQNEGSTAFEIAKEYLKKDVELLFVEFPMLKNPEDRKKYRENNANEIKMRLDKGKKVGFLTIGDPMTYSTYVYILEYLDESYTVKTIPGISSFLDMGSRFNIPLVMGEESLKIVSLNKKIDLREIIENNENIVFMKVSRNFERLYEVLKESGNLNNIIMVSNSGKENEKVIFDLDSVDVENIPYFTTMILKKGGIEQWKKFIS